VHILDDGQLYEMSVSFLCINCRSTIVCNTNICLQYFETVGWKGIISVNIIYGVLLINESAFI